MPEDEALVIPDDMYRECVSCRLRHGCLVDAVLTDSQGYWAGTTHAQRRRLLRDRRVTVSAADQEYRNDLARLRERPRRNPTPQHPPGEESLDNYRAGCGCDGCRAHNAANRRDERARKRSETIQT